ncbi:MAG: helix-turn-helix domain-containing protein [Thermocrinis sp.]|jgi:transcriptional regulator with XRE-family HTH domain|uniref:helix-turn-helix domain-containing protein n=1 Tax=Thermocrinis sp. TaxID=2024383 RepID=UPI003C116A09
MKMHQGLIKELVKERCKERGLSLSRLAMEIGVNPTYLLFVLHGRNISRPLVRKVAEYLGYSELPAVYEEYLEYLRERRRKLKEIARLLEEEAEGAAGTPSARRWQDGKRKVNS